MDKGSDNRQSFHGFLVVDKPGGITSRAAVDRAKHWFPRHTRIGHTGTLDPLATGLLVLCVGAARRLSEYVQNMPKTYRTGFTLGTFSTTDDAEGVLEPVAGANPPLRGAVEKSLASLVGDLLQVPPAFSAVKIEGRRACDLVRQGQEVILSPRQVKIYEIRILSYAYPLLELEIHCGKGTYIRSLARQLGQQLGCGAYVQTLRRTQVGPFTEGDAMDLNASQTTAREALLPLAAGVSELPAATLSFSEVTRLRNGLPVPLADDVAAGSSGLELALFDQQGQLVGIGRWQAKLGVVQPAKMLPLFDKD